MGGRMRCVILGAALSVVVLPALGAESKLPSMEVKSAVRWRLLKF